MRIEMTVYKLVTLADQKLVTVLEEKLGVYVAFSEQISDPQR